VGVLHGGEMIATGRPAQLMEQFRDDVFRVLTREPDHPAFEALHAEYRVPVVGRPDLGDSPWRAVDLEIASGEEGAAQVVAALVRAGVSVARCEKVPLSLADLLERVVAARANRRDQA
jgi:ABC-type multidrug transport system ATPase subunit